MTEGEGYDSKIPADDQTELVTAYSSDLAKSLAIVNSVPLNSLSEPAVIFSVRALEGERY